MKTEFKYANNTTICIKTTDEGLKFYGEAKCHPEDEDKYSQERGRFISSSRADIQILRYALNTAKNLVKNQEHMMGCMEQSRKFNPKTNEFRLLRRDYHSNVEAVQVLKDQIAYEQMVLNYYINKIK